MRKHALNIAAFVWGVAEATLFFIVPDVILSYIGLRQGPRAAAIASIYAACGAAVGGAIMFVWSANAADAARRAVLAVPAISEDMAARAEQATAANWFMATLTGPLTNTPFKLFAILAPHAGAPFAAFALAAIAARLPRFLIVSIGVALIGRALSRWLSERQLNWVLIGAWLLFYVQFFARMPN
jgi:membrane protein YqaA with SNARE-associated domain